LAARRAPGGQPEKDTLTTLFSQIAILLAAAAAPEGVIAHIRSTEQEDQCVVVTDLATGVETRVGPGRRDGAPRWSPDGEWLAFTTEHADGMGIYAVRHDGRDGRVVSRAHRWNHAPEWDRTGKRIAYTASNEMDLALAVTVYDRESGEETAWGGGRQGLLRPVWLPSLLLMQALDPSEEVSFPGVDTARFLSEGRGEGVLISPGLTGEPGQMCTDLYLVTRSEVMPVMPFVLPPDARYEEWAASPDGKGERFIFESNDGGDREIYMLNRRGIANVSNHRAADWNPVWSPNGDFVAFESFRGGRRGVYRVYPDTARVIAVAAGDDYDCWWPAWSPDSNWIAYVSDETGDIEIHAVRVRGGDPVQLTHQPGPDLAPAWRPAGKG
jgi:Tol biopolymer transport system component